MTARTQDFETEKKPGVLQFYKMDVSTVIFKGTVTFAKSATGLAFTNDGTTNTLANGDVFLGISYEAVTTGVSVDADSGLRVEQEGTHRMNVTDALTDANIGDAVFVNNVSDDDEVTITSHTANPQATIGRIVEVIDASTARVSVTLNAGFVAAAGA